MNKIVLKCLAVSLKHSDFFRVKSLNTHNSLVICPRYDLYKLNYLKKKLCLEYGNNNADYHKKK